MRILIADDSATIRRIIKEMLGGRDDEWIVCAEACDGEDTLRKTREIQPDVVLLDLSIPRLSGLETARILRRDCPESVVILMSAQEPAMLERMAASARIPFSISKATVAKGLVPLLETISQQRHGPPEALRLRSA
jgi:two-component system nitrate/nitrite response regulator NarL